MKRWKPPYKFYIFLYIITVLVSLSVASDIEEGDTIITWYTKYSLRLNSNPLLISLNKYSLRVILFGIIVVTLYIAYDTTKPRNWMHGREYGNRKWADIDKLNKKFADSNPNYNRIYSNNLRISMNGSKTKLNNNALVIGGSGAGKTLFGLTPNVYQASSGLYPGSYVFTDPKGELLQYNGQYLKNAGYNIKVVNLTTEGMSESDGFNPFVYIRRQTDIDKLITNLFANTTPANATKGDPFWEKAEMMFLQALFLYVWLEADRLGIPKNIPTVMDLLDLAEVNDDGTPSPLDELFDKLVIDTKGQRRGGKKHPAYIKYKKSVRGAADTVRSIVISANARMTIFDNDDVRQLLSADELDLASLGSGKVNGEKNVKTALFCIIPDADPTYNCIAGMLYTLLFQELYALADSPINKGKLPVPVTFWLDEFANIALPDNFTKLLATMRSRLISAVIIIQNMAQIKKIYDKDWEVIPGNCDVLLYLGGNEQSTHKYISDNLGNCTIWKRSKSRQFGRNGSNSKSEDIIKRELMTQDEVGMLDNSKCIVFIRGESPVLDDKFKTLESETFAKANALGIYVHSEEKNKMSIINKKIYNDIVKSGAKVQDILLQSEDIDEALLGEHITAEDINNILAQQTGRTDIYDVDDTLAEREIDITELTLEDVLCIPEFILTDEEMQEVIQGIDDGLSDEEIKSYILYDNAARMRAKRLTIVALKKRRVVQQQQAQ